MTEPRHDPVLAERLTMAIFHGFWEGDPSPPTWQRTPEYQRVQFRIMARRAIEAAALLKAERAKPQPPETGREAA